MMRQKPDSYDPKKDSPLIGGYGEEGKIPTLFFPKEEYKGKLNGAVHAMLTPDVIGLLEQAAEEFPKKQVIHFRFFGKDVYLYDADPIDRWKKKWLTVPPV